jgi:hypothetical protein
VRSLAQITGHSILSLPLLDDGRGRPLLEVLVGGRPLTVLLDTGFALPLRLTRSSLRQLGLPDDDESWIARGAVPYPVSGAFGHSGEGLLVQLDVDLVLGPVLLERPWTLISDQSIGIPGSGAEPLSLVGGGLLLPFAQVGFDWPGQRIELVLRGGAAPGGGGAADAGSPGVLRVPPAGTFLGFILGPPEAGRPARPRDLPRVIHLVAGSLAERSGLHSGDFISAIDGISCANSAPLDLWPKLRLGAGGRQQLALTIHRDGAERELLLAGP